MRFFDKEDEKNPTLLKAGMFLKFKAISKDEFFDIQEQVAKKSIKRKFMSIKIIEASINSSLQDFGRKNLLNLA